jgi:cellulose synthase/poly-beta-1,6-N-acetylglucosamine synthase-like glycosyltransferase
MLAWLDVVVVVCTLFYALVIAWLCTGIVRGRHIRPSNDGTPSVSVIVAARNEADHITSCVSALQQQDYPGPLEVIVVDDRSTDGTGALVEAVARESTSVHKPFDLSVVYAPTDRRYACPKKSALAAGIEASRGELLLLTDADCAPPATWVAALVRNFTDDVGLVAGFACVEPLDQHRHRVLAVDNLGVSAMAEGSLGMGLPLSCTGRNLAYRRSLWDSVGGFDDIGHMISGDDVYFLRLVAARTETQAGKRPDHGLENRIVYCADPASVVTGPARRSNFRQIIEQKLRHASKAGHYQGGARWLGMAVYGYHAALLAGLLQAALGEGRHGVILAAWIIRWVMDFVLIAYFAPRGRRDRVLLTFLPIVEALYIPYVLFFVPLGRSGRFRWKQAEPPNLSQPLPTGND